MEKGISIKLNAAPTVICPACGAGGITETMIGDEFEYGTGKEAVTLRAHVPLCHCSSCELDFTDWRGEELRHDAVCAHLKILKPAQIAAIRERHGLTQQEFADMSRIGRASLVRWETGAVFQNGSSDNFLYLLCFPDNIDRLRSRTNVTERLHSTFDQGPHRFRALSDSSIDIYRRESTSFQLHLDS